MQVFNLTSLNISQEVPRVLFKPINLNKEYVFFEKLLNGKDDTWSEGIWAYHINTHQMHRMDQGQHVAYQELYDFDTPQIFWNGTSKIDPDAMYFATITELDGEEYIEFYEIDLLSGVQRNVLGFRFPKEELYYKSMDLLAPGYILLRLCYNVEYMDLEFFDEVYLIDVKEKSYYPIYDEIFKISAGSLIVSGSGENARVFVEEYYLEEEEQYDILTSDEVELVFELPEGIDLDILYKNSIRTILLSDFVLQVKEGREKIELEIIDEMFKDGSLRLIGETDRDIFYKKQYYDFVLKERGDFLSLRKIGSYELYRLDKATLHKELVRDIHGDIQIKTSTQRAYIINESRFHATIEDAQTQEIVFDYKKRFVGRAYESVAELVNDEYFIVNLRSDDPKVASYMIVDVKTDEMIVAGHDVLILQDYIFVI